MYSPYNVNNSTVLKDIYKTNNTTVSGYGVPTYNANNTNG